METNLLISISLAVVPSLLLIWFFYKMDANPEPRGVLITTFVLGVVIVAPVLVVALPTLFFVVPHLVFEGKLTAVFSEASGKAFLSAAIPEEFFKWVVVVLYCSRHKEFDEPMDGLVYGAVASLGFATFENVLYVWEAEQLRLKLHLEQPIGLYVAIARGLTAVPCHAFLGAIMGYFVGQARFSRTGSKGLLYVLSLLIPILLHGNYDLWAMAMPGVQLQNDGMMMLTCVLMVFGTLIVMGIWTLILVVRLRGTQFPGRPST